jgi:hypothetical protein
MIEDSIIQTIANNGVLGIVLSWFMFRMEKVINKNTEATSRLAEVVATCPKKP